MCRWMAWFGQPVLIEEMLFKTPHGIVDQSLHSRMGAETTNGDGFGLGWYGTGEGPGVYRSVEPAWGDANLRELAAHIESPLFIAHVRAAIGSPVQQTNCHPFRHGRGCSSTTATSPTSAAQARTDARHRAGPVRRRPRIDGHRGGLPARAHVRARGGPDRVARADHRLHRDDRAQARGRRPGAGQLRRLGRRPACGRCATRAMGGRGRCSPPPTSTRCAACIPTTRDSRPEPRRPGDRL